MDKKVVSIEVGRDFSYIISMYEDFIQEIIYIPRDYKAEEIISAMLYLIPFNSLEDIICYDANGLGVMIGEAIGESSLKKLIKPMNYKEIVESAVALDFAKKKLSEIDTCKYLSGFEYLEFKKLCDEINNLEAKQVGFTLKLAQKDKSIGKARASCYLQGLYMLMNNK